MGVPGSFSNETVNGRINDGGDDVLKSAFQKKPSHERQTVVDPTLRDEGNHFKLTFLLSKHFRKHVHAVARFR